MVERQYKAISQLGLIDIDSESVLYEGVCVWDDSFPH